MPEWRLAMLAMAVDFALFPVFPVVAVVVPALVASRYPGRTWILSIIESAFAVGMILGGAVVVRRSNATLGRRLTVPCGFAALGAGFAGTGAAVSLIDADTPMAFTAVAGADRAITRLLDMPDEALDGAYLREFPHAFGAAAPRAGKALL